jgi:hypothetical protein
MSSTNNTQVGYQWKPTTKKVVKQQRKDFSEENSNDDTGISLCLRFVFKNVGPGRVFNIMKKPIIINENGERVKVSLGFIERVDHIIRRDGNKTYFIHFRKQSWNFRNNTPFEALENMKSGKAVEIINDEHGHFWKATISKAQRPEDAGNDTRNEEPSGDYEGAISDGDVQNYTVAPFSYDDVNDFPDIENEVSAEIAELTEQKGEEKTAEQKP